MKTAYFILPIMVMLWLGLTMNSKAQDQGNASHQVSVSQADTVLRQVSTNTVIEQGTSGEARRVSGKNQSLVLHISGGAKDKYSAEQYARMLKAMFNDPQRTKFPTDISVLYSESGKDRPTGVYAFVHGHTFDKNGGGYFAGDGVFTTAEIVQWIPKITEQYDRTKKN